MSIGLAPLFVVFWVAGAVLGGNGGLGSRREPGRLEWVTYGTIGGETTELLPEMFGILQVELGIRMET